MFAVDEHGKFGAFIHGGAAQVRRVAVLSFGKGHLGPALADQLHQVVALGDQAFQFEVRVAGFEIAEGGLETVGLVGVGNHHRQPRFQAPGQLAGAHLKAVVGGEDVFGLLQHDMAGRSQAGLAGTAVEQLEAQIDFQARDGRADGRLALAQLARRSGKRTQGRGLDKGLEHFIGSHELSLLSMVIDF